MTDHAGGRPPYAVWADVVRLLTERGETFSCAESLTGGLVGAAITSVPGSSQVFPGGVVAYSHELKSSLLGVDGGRLRSHGAVDEEIARQMCAGILRRSGSTWAIATTGNAGPDASDGQPVGLVYVAVGDASRIEVHELRLAGERDAIRAGVVERAGRELQRRLEERTLGQ